MHLLLFVDFFQQCIMMSGTDLSRSAFLNPYWKPKNYATELAEKVGCQSEDSYQMMECMKNNNTVTWQKLLEAQESIAARVSTEKNYVNHVRIAMLP